MTSKILNNLLTNINLQSYEWCSEDEMLYNIKQENYKAIEHIKYMISHDGYDKHGPKSDIYDIFIWHKNNNKFYIDSYHCEEWYDFGSKPVFEKEYTYKILYEKEWKNLIKCNNNDFFLKLRESKK